MCRALMDLQTEAAAMRANPQRSAAAAALRGGRSPDQIGGNRSSTRPSFFISRTSTIGGTVGVNTPIINS